MGIEMIQNFLTVAQQVAILFVLIAVGFVCGKQKLLDDRIAKGLSDLVLLFATPAIIIGSFIRPFETTMLRRLLISFGLSAVFHAVGILLAFLCIRGKNRDRVDVSRFAVIFSNAGYMAFPLQEAILGEDGVFFGSAYVVVFNVILWTLGFALMAGKKEKIRPKKLLLNPGVISVVVGLTLFLSNSASFLPPIVTDSMQHLANLNTPLPMIVIGFYLSKAKISSAFADRRIIWPLALRLLVCPAICIGILALFRIDSTIAVTYTVAISTPVAAATTMFAAKYDRDTTLSVNAVSVSTLLSILTLPLFVAFAQSFFHA